MYIQILEKSVGLNLRNIQLNMRKTQMTLRISKTY